MKDELRLNNENISPFMLLTLLFKFKLYFFLPILGWKGSTFHYNYNNSNQNHDADADSMESF